jgi:hypothetical protein
MRIPTGFRTLARGLENPGWDAGAIDKPEGLVKQAVQISAITWS